MFTTVPRLSERILLYNERSMYPLPIKDDSQSLWVYEARDSMKFTIFQKVSLTLFKDFRKIIVTKHSWWNRHNAIKLSNWCPIWFCISLIYFFFILSDNQRCGISCNINILCSQYWRWVRFLSEPLPDDLKTET